MSKENPGFDKLLKERFGMFVHYGIYSSMEGEYNGRATTGLGEWIQHDLRIPNAEYEAFGREHFKTSPDFAKNLVRSAKDAGIKYIVITSKHHDGFCLFKSDYTNYSTYDFFGRDVCLELADECRKEGLGLGFYYSHTLDWREKDAGGNVHSSMHFPCKNRNNWDYPDDNICFEKYFYEKCFPQVRELLTNYGELELIWFDFPHDITKEQSLELRKLVKSLQPNCQINSRIAHDCNDYLSLGDNTLPIAPVDVDLECLITLNDTWGYKKSDRNWKNVEEVCDILTRTLGSDSTLLLNVGPMGDGSLTPETLDILQKMGEWTRRNGEAVYGEIKGNPFPMTFRWGSASVKDKSLYLYVKDKTCKELFLPIGNNPVKGVSVIGSDKNPEYTHGARLLTVKQIDTELMIPVYRVDFEKEPVFDGEIYQTGNILSLGTLWAGKTVKGSEDGELQGLVYEKSRYSKDYGKHGLAISENCNTTFWTDTRELLCWDAYFEEAGEYEAVLINPYTYMQKEKREAKSEFSITLGTRTNKVNMKEEKSRFGINETCDVNIFICHDAGRFTVEKAGKYRIFVSKEEGFDDLPIAGVEFKKI